ncbi:LysR family transcriptional regulator [Pseudomonas sp. WPR_5_2]|uniref:LysR family transcriptional regulator n=1 Tax=Pseudomonas sp. WPR_5_2 TaxID=1907371 RepID=UPI000EADAEF3|nr:LysR family transcriptional regulator [Pseudomonas sp. WPR_5_2]
MELRHLKHFIGVAEELHFGRAADRLHIEQSPLSRSIKDLENDLGVKLFDRTTRSTKLTDAGKVFLREARQVLLAAEKARLCINSNWSPRTTTIRIAITENLAQPYTTRLFELVKKENPKLKICISEINERHLIASLKSGKIDAAISPINIAMEGFTAIPLWREAIATLIPINHQLSTNTTISLEDIASHPLVY